jgi:hypothetical protein
MTSGPSRPAPPRRTGRAEPVASLAHSAGRHASARLSAPRLPVGAGRLPVMGGGRQFRPTARPAVRQVDPR